MRSHLILLSLVAALAACPASDTPDPPTPSPTATPSPTPSPTPVDAPSWRVEPVALAFPPTALGQMRQATISVENVGDTALTLTAAAPGAPFVVEPASAPLAVGARVQLTVSYAPTTEGPHAATLRLSSGDAKLAPVDIALLGNTLGATVQVSTTAVDFGEVVMATVGRAEVTLTNPTTAPLTVFTATTVDVQSCDHPGAARAHYCFTSPARSLGAEGRFELAAGEVLPLALEFRPTVAGLRATGTLGLRACSGAVCPDVTHTLTLTGVGVASSVRCDAQTLDFGRVGTVACATRTLTCRNASTVQRGLVDIGLDATRTSTAFTLIGAPSSIELAGGDQVVLDVRYCPGGSGADAGALVLQTDDPDPTQRTVEIALLGTGGGPDLEVAPERVDFGVVPSGVPTRRALTLLNLGDEPLVLSRVVTPAELTVVGDVTTPLAPGEARAVALELVLPGPAMFAGDVVLYSNDPVEPEVRVSLEAVGQVLPTCTYEVVPSVLELGVVEPSRSVSRAVEIRNTGAGECVLGAARLTAGSDPSFALAEDRRNLSIAPGSSRVVTVTFAPLLPGQRTATLELSMSSATAPLATVPVTGSGESLTLLISPHELDFGVIDLTCRARERPVAIYNTGVQPLLITDIRLAAPLSSVFSLGGLPAFTATVAPGGFVEFEVGFVANDAAEYASAIEVVTGTGAQALTHVLGLRGQGAVGGVQVDRYSQLGEPLVDILWIIDDSGSMGEEQASLAANFLSFVRFADAQGLDYHMAITTTDVSGGENGRFVPLTGTAPRVVTPQTTPSPVAVFTQNARVGTGGSGSERGLEAAYLALSNPLIAGHNAGFLRPEAALSVIYVSDEEDSSTRTIDFYVSFLLGIKGAQNANTFTASAIVGDAPSGCSGSGGSAQAGARYIEVAERTGGLVQSICTPDWGRALENVSTTAFGFKSRFVLSGQPVPATLVVAVDGAVVPAVDAQGAPRWSYDAGANAVVFTPYATPEPGAQIRIEYRAECL